jgi:hypothetical protein
MAKFARPNAYNGRKANPAWTGEARFATQTEASAGTRGDLIVSPLTLDTAVDTLVVDATTVVKGKIRIGTVAEQAAGVLNTVVVTPVGLAAMAIAGAPDASEILKGIAMLATQAETNTGTNDAKIVTPLKLTTHLASPNPIGSVAPNTGAFTNLAATGVGTGNIMTSDTASGFGVTGALADLTLNSDAGRVIINGEEAAANAITLVSAAGGIDVDAALAINIDTSEVAATALTLNASGGGIDMTAAANDIDIAATLASVNITANEAIADGIVLSSTAGGIDILSGGAALNIDITATGGSINLSATENAADAITITSTAGGMDISCVGTAGEDIDILATGSSINLTSTEDAASAIYLRANGGVSETVYIRADQGTGVASVNIVSDVGGVTINGGVASADAINITCGNAAGGIDIDAGTAGIIGDTTGAISLDGAAASNFTVGGAGIDLSLISTLGRVIINGEEAAANAITLLSAAGGIDVDAALQISIVSAQVAADAIVIDASNAAGGIDVDCGSGGLDILATAGAISIDAQLASNLTVTGAGQDLTIASVLGSIVVDASEAAATAVAITASGGGMDLTAAVNDIDIVATLASINITANEDAADAVVITSAAGGIDIAAVGAAAQDIDISNTGGSVNISATEAIATAVTISATAGGIDITAPGAGAGLDIDITNTGGSVNITATESIVSAIIIDAAGAAGGIQLDAGTSGVNISTGLIFDYIEINTAAHSPYTVVGGDYYIGTDTTGGAMAITLPAAPEVGRTYVIQDAVGQAAIGGAITITGTAGNIVAAGASAATYVLNTAYESISVTWNGTVWLGRAVV